MKIEITFDNDKIPLKFLKKHFELISSYEKYS